MTEDQPGDSASPEENTAAASPQRVERAQFTDYSTSLAEPSRPPSRGGNTRARHRHALLVDGVSYSFFAQGAKKWAFAGDLVSFDWSWDPSRQYRNIDKATLETVDKNGKPVVRGDRSWKRLRTASARMPASRREQRD